MGWRELCGYQRAMVKAKRGPEPDPGSWDGADQDPGWQQLRDRRDRLRGR